MRSIAAEHNCEVPEYPEGWSGWTCPVCDTRWTLDLSYEGPGYTNPVYQLVRDD